MALMRSRFMRSWWVSAPRAPRCWMSQGGSAKMVRNRWGAPAATSVWVIVLTGTALLPVPENERTRPRRRLVLGVAGQVVGSGSDLITGRDERFSNSRIARHVERRVARCEHLPPEVNCSHRAVGLALRIVLWNWQQQGDYGRCGRVASRIWCCA